MKYQRFLKIEEIEFKVVYSRRSTIGISVLPDSSVIVRVPYLTSLKTINRIVKEKYSWVIKHRDNYRELDNRSRNKSYTSGEIHLFRGKESLLKIEKSAKPYVIFFDSTIELGTEKTDDPETVRRLLYKGYKNEAITHFPILMRKVLNEHENEKFKPEGLIIRTMKRRCKS